MGVPKSRESLFGSVPTPESVKQFKKRLEEFNQTWAQRLAEKGGEGLISFVEKVLVGGKIKELPQE